MTQARIVIVEDERIVALGLQMKLKSLGYAVDAVVPSSEGALQAIAEHRPDIVLMDIHIEGAIDGIDTALRIPSELGTPVIFLTAFSEQATVERARAAKPYGYLIKPYSDRELHATIQMALERRVLLEELDQRRAQADLAAQQLAEREQFFRILAENVHEIIVRHDPHGLIQYVSPSVDQLGFTPEEVIGRNVMEFYHPDERDVLGAALARMRDGFPPRPANEREYRLLRKDGDWIWVTSNPTTLRDETGTIVGMLSVLHDVSMRREMQAELIRKRKEAEAGLKAKADFLANMSHELRTPLTGVLGYAGLLGQVEGLPEDARRHVDRIQASGRALLAIVNDILDFTRLEQAQVELAPRPFAPQALAMEAVELVRPLAEAKGLAIEVEAAPGLPDALVADGARIRQVLLNLVGNAVKFTDQGRVTVEVNYAAEAQRLRLAVRDTGVGIAAEALERLFVRFSQVDGAASRRFSGAGLGLAISKGLVELMGGEIGVESLPGAGSTFWIEMPAPIGRAEPAADAVEAAAPEVRPLRILLVDDLEVNRELVSAMLAQFDVAITEASSGAEAVAASLRERFDLVLMDLQMPGMDGMEATRAIRASAELNQATPILALSANVMADQIEACRAAGMNDHIAKPIEPRNLLAKIAYWTEEADDGAQAAQA